MPDDQEWASSLGLTTVAAPDDDEKWAKSLNLDYTLATPSPSSADNTPPRPRLDAPLESLAKSQWNPVTAAGTALEYWGEIGKAANQDFFESTARLAYPGASVESPIRNLKAAALGEETPRSQEIRSDNSWADLPQRALEAGISSLPRVAASEAIGGPLGSALAFGLTSRGIDPGQAAIGALFPGAADIGEKLAVAALGKQVATKAGLDALKTGGSILATQALMEAANAPYYLNPDVPFKEKAMRLAEDIATNIGFSSPKIVSALRGFASDALKSPAWEKITTTSANQETNANQISAPVEVAGGEPARPAASMAEGIPSQPEIAAGTVSPEAIVEPAAEAAPVRPAPAAVETPIDLGRVAPERQVTPNEKERQQKEGMLIPQASVGDETGAGSNPPTEVAARITPEETQPAESATSRTLETVREPTDTEKWLAQNNPVWLSGLSSRTGSTQSEGGYELGGGRKLVEVPLGGDARGKAYIFEDTPESRREALWWHELAVHRGIQQFMRQGGALAQELRTLVSAAEPLLMREADVLARRKKYRDANDMAADYGFDRTTAAGREAFVLELLANKAEELANKPKPTWWAELVGQLQLLVAKHFGIRLTASGVEQLIRSGAKRSEGMTLETRTRANTDGTTDVAYALARTEKEAKHQIEMGERGAAEAIVAAHQKPVELLNRFFAGLPGAVRRLLSIPENERILAAGATRTSINNYDAALADADARHDNYARSEIVNGAKDRLKLIQQSGIRLRTETDELRQEVESPAFKRMVTKLDDATTKKELAERAIQTYESQMAQNVDVMQHELDVQKVRTATEDQLRSDIRRVKQLTQYSKAVADTAADIADVLAQTGMLEDGTATGTEIARAYLSARGEKAPRGESRAALVNLASQVLAANRDLASNLAAYRSIRDDPELRTKFDNFSAQIRNLLGKGDAAGAATFLLEGAAKRSAALQKVSRIWSDLNKPVAETLRNLREHQSALDAYDALEADKDWRSYVSKVYKNAGEERIPDIVRVAPDGKPFMERQFVGEQTLIDPFGINYPISLGSTGEQAAATQGMVNAFIQSLDTWLNDPANANSPDREFWTNRQRYAEASLASSSLRNPSGNVPFALIPGMGDILRHSWFHLDYLFSQLKLPAAKLTRMAAENVESAMNWMRGWNGSHEKAMVGTATRAALAHDYDPNMTGNGEWQRNVLNEMNFASRSGRKLAVGDILDSGVEILPQDMEAFRTQGKSWHSLFTGVMNIGRGKLMDDKTVVDDFIAGMWGVRRALERGATAMTTIPRKFSQRGRDLASLVGRAAARASPSEIKAILDAPNNFEFVQRWIQQQRASYVREKSVFAAPYELLAELWRRDEPTAPKTVDGVVNFLKAHSTPDVGEHAEQTFLGELTAYLSNVYEKFFAPPEPGSPKLRTAEEENSFSRGFETDIGPSYMYDSGAVTESELADVAVDASTFHIAKLATSLESLINQMEAKVGEMRGMDVNKKEASKKFWAGSDFVNYETLESQLKEVKQFRSLLDSWVGPASVESQLVSSGDFRRMARTIIAGKLSGVATLAHIVTNAAKPGSIFADMDRGLLFSWPKAMASMAMSAMKVGGGTLVGGAKVLARGSPGALKALWNTDGSLRTKYATAVSKLFEGYAQEMSKRSEFLRQQVSMGLMTNVDLSNALFNIITLPQSGGKGYDPKLEGKSPLVRVPLSVIRNGMALGPEPFLHLVKQLFPQLGYDIAYDSAARQAQWTLRVLEAQAYRAFDTMEKTGTLGRFDLGDVSSPKNRLTASLVLPRGVLTKTETNLNRTRDWFRALDISYDDAVLSYWKRLAETPPDKRNEIRMLSADVTDPMEAKRTQLEREIALAAVNLRDVHHASFTNRSQILRKVGWIGQLTQPFAGWGLQTLRQNVDVVLGRAAGDPEFGAAMQKAIGGLTVLSHLAVWGLSGTVTAAVVAAVRHFFNKEEELGKPIWKAKDASEAARIFISNAANQNHFISTAVDKLLGTRNTRSGLGFDVFVLNEANSWLDQIRGMIATGDPFYGLAKFVSNELPVLRPFINRLPNVEGAQEKTNVTRLLRQVGPEELARPQQTAPPTPTPLSPIRQELANAIYSGDSAALPDIKARFIAKAQELGRTDAPALFSETISALNPWRAAFGERLTDAQRTEALGKLTPSEQKQVRTSEANWETAAGQLGVNAAETRIPRVAVGSAGTGIGATASTGVRPRGAGNLTPLRSSTLRGQRRISRSIRSPRLRAARSSYRIARARTFGPRRVRI